MRRRGVVDRQRLRIADVREVAEQLKAVDEGLASLKAALYSERDERAAAADEHLLRQFVVVVALQARVVHPGDGVVGLEVLGDLQGVLLVTLHSQRERLDALQDEEGVERRERGAGVAQQHRAAARDVGGRAHRVAPDDAVVARVGLHERLEALGILRPVEVAGVDDRATDRGAMAADELRQRVDGDVGALLEDLRADRRRDGVVEYERHADRMRRVSPGGHVEHV